LLESYGKLPLSFEINKGQTDLQVKFLSRGSGYSLFLTDSEAVLALRKGSRQSKLERRRVLAAYEGNEDLVSRSAAFPTPLLPTTVQLRDSFVPHNEARIPNPESRTSAVLRMKLVGANPHAKVIGLEELPGKSNYFTGNDPKKWRTDVPTYAKVKYRDVYPGVDLIYYGNHGQLEYDFVVAPGADPGQIVVDVGAGLAPALGNRQGVSLRIDRNGELVAKLDDGEVRFQRPLIYHCFKRRQTSAQ